LYDGGGRLNADNSLRRGRSEEGGEPGIFLGGEEIIKKRDRGIRRRKKRAYACWRGLNLKKGMISITSFIPGPGFTKVGGNPKISRRNGERGEEKDDNGR